MVGGTCYPSQRPADRHGGGSDVMLWNYEWREVNVFRMTVTGRDSES
jgi:hypothetical protein